jgi:hypothetical protein
VLESDRLREIECAVAVALKTHTAAREAESQKHAEQMNEMRQLLLKMSKSNETRETQSTADFEQKLVAAASIQYAEQLRVAQQLLLNLTKSNSAAAAPEVTAEQLEEAAEAKLTQLREIDISARKIFEKMYSPPVTLPVFPETPGNLLAALNVFCATTGTKCLFNARGGSLANICGQCVEDTATRRNRCSSFATFQPGGSYVSRWRVVRRRSNECARAIRACRRRTLLRGCHGFCARCSAYEHDDAHDAR